jgi:hypothetical protein
VDPNVVRKEGLRNKVCLGDHCSYCKVARAPPRTSSTVIFSSRPVSLSRPENADGRTGGLRNYKWLCVEVRQTGCKYQSNSRRHWWGRRAVPGQGSPPPSAHASTRASHTHGQASPAAPHARCASSEAKGIRVGLNQTGPEGIHQIEPGQCITHRLLNHFNRVTRSNLCLQRHQTVLHCIDGLTKCGDLYSRFRMCMERCRLQS